MKNGNKFSEKEIRKIVKAKLKHMERPELSDIVEIIRPFYKWKKDYLLERELKRKARVIMSSFKDENGVRTYFSQNRGSYINIEKSTDLDDLNKVSVQLKPKYAGLSKSIEKVRARIAFLLRKLNGANIKEG